ncbi:ubiquitin hydrolase, putative [Leishmania tarentolae]|uniref:Ubiquitin hydrolase, putative n=1 Tax=Leishmania tarentolae TaxID=5689 RepID=A0A640KT17_LEITA|nr:ubiquitin hydrolase, putative [Leishmania tarentolae]
MCYLNSMAQCLLCTPGLVRTLNIDHQRSTRQGERKRRSDAMRKPDHAQWCS